MSKYARTYTNSLFDRGANGGVSGEDTRVICTNLDRKVRIYGIDNHEINSILIIKSGRETKTIVEYAIVILYQYAYYGKGKISYSAGKI